jgi:hypothetical protein
MTAEPFEADDEQRCGEECGQYMAARPSEISIYDVIIGRKGCNRR